MSQSHGAILPVGLPLDDPDDYGLRARYERHLRAEHRPRTIEAYLAAYDSLLACLVQHGMPRDAGAIRREHIEAWLVWLRDTGRSEGTLNNRYRALTALWQWLVDEGELLVSSEKGRSVAVAEVVERAGRLLLGWLTDQPVACELPGRVDAPGARTTRQSSRAR